MIIPFFTEGLAVYQLGSPSCERQSGNQAEPELPTSALMLQFWSFTVFFVL